MKQLLIVKSDQLNDLQLQQLTQKNIQVTNLNLLTFQLNEINIDQNEHYDYILFNSTNGVESFHKSYINKQENKFLVVGQKTKEKVQILLQNNNIISFKCQQELNEYLLNQDNKLNLLYIIGNLSEISNELQIKHNVKIIEGYKTLPIKEEITLDYNKFDYIVYFSNSNYIEFKKLNVQLKPQTLNIFFGQKCSKNQTEINYKILESPTFDALLNIL